MVRLLTPERIRRYNTVRVVGQDKEPIGVMNTDDALDMADELDVDLVIITEDADPPVARLCDWSKLKCVPALPVPPCLPP